MYIGNEICALTNLSLSNLTVRAHRVGVHIGHFVDVRVKVRCPELLTSVDAVQKAFEAFAPLKHLYGPEMPSLPSQPVKVIREVGAPRPATHNQEFGGMQVAVHASLAAEALRAHALVAEVRARVLPEEHFWQAWVNGSLPVRAGRLMAYSRAFSVRAREYTPLPLYAPQELTDEDLPALLADPRFFARKVLPI